MYTCNCRFHACTNTDFDKSAKAFVLFCLYFNFGLGNRTPAIEGQTNEKEQLTQVDILFHIYHPLTYFTSAVNPRLCEVCYSPNTQSRRHYSMFH